jgi:hypothetical protein
VSTSHNSSVAEHAEGQGQIPAETTTQVNRVLSHQKESDRSTTKKTSSRTKAVAEDSDPETAAEFEEIVKKPFKTAADLKKAQDDPFKPENLRLDQSVLQAQAAKRLLITVPVRNRTSRTSFGSIPIQSIGWKWLCSITSATLT